VLLGLIPLLILRRPAFVVEAHDAPGSSRHRMLTDRFEGAISRMFGTTVICHSTSVEQEVARLWRIPSGRLVRFPLSVDTELFQPIPETTRRAWRASHGIEENDVVLVAVGRLVPSKRFDILIQILARLKAVGVPAKLVVVGRGRGADALKTRAESLGVADAVHLLQDVAPGQPLVDVLGSGDVLCSASEYEGFGLTIVEGMSVGLPVVATAVGGVSDLVEEGSTGFLVRPGDLGGLLDRLTDLTRNPKLRSAMGRAGRDRALAQYRVDAMAANFEALYQRLA
jgi:glycosyltransferase involved in cell wall biosynthesis